MLTESAYSPGTLVQIISVSEFDSFPKNEDGDSIIGKSSNGTLDIPPYTRRSLCGCLAKIKRFAGPGVLSRLPFYELALYDSSSALDPIFAAKFNWPMRYFSVNEFHPVSISTPTPSFPFDDLLKGVP